MSATFQTIDALRSSLDYHLDRHNVLSSNLANVDTPGFRPQELLRDGSGLMPGGKLGTTHQAHFETALGIAGTDGAVVVEDRSVAIGNDGNAVSLEREMSKLAANDLRFEGGVQIVSRQLAVLRYAANDGTGG